MYTCNVFAIDDLYVDGGCTYGVFAGTRDETYWSTTVGRFWRLFGVSDDVATTTVAAATAAVTIYTRPPITIFYIKL